MNKILTLILVVLSLQLNAQQSSAEEYEIVAQHEKYKIEKTEILCNSNQGYEYVYVVLKFTNLTAEELTLDFVFETWYSGVCTNCEDTDRGTQRSITLLPNEVVEGECGPNRSFLKTFSHSNTVHPNAYKGQLSDLIVEKVNILK